MFFNMHLVLYHQGGWTSYDYANAFNHEPVMFALQNYGAEPS